MKPTYIVTPITVEGRPHRPPRAPRRPAKLRAFVASYVPLLDALEIEGPPDARDLIERHLALKAERRTLARAERLNRNEVAAQVVAGELSVEDASARVAEAVAHDPGAELRQRRDILKQAAFRAVLDAAAEVYDYGEQQWLAELATAAGRALDGPKKARAQETWDGVHRLALLLRQLGALSSLKGAGREYRFAAVDLVHEWLLEHADRVVDGVRIDERERRLIELRPIRPPALTIEVIAEHREEWGPGVYSAEQALEHARRVVARENERMGGGRRRSGNRFL